MVHTKTILWTFNRNRSMNLRSSIPDYRHNRHVVSQIFVFYSFVIIEILMEFVFYSLLYFSSLLKSNIIVV
jgi:hypothetical protein